MVKSNLKRVPNALQAYPRTGYFAEDVLRACYGGTKHPAQVKQMQSLGTRALAIVVAAFREPGWIRRIGLLFVVFGVPSLVAFP